MYVKRVFHLRNLSFSSAFPRYQEDQPQSRQARGLSEVRGQFTVDGHSFYHQIVKLRLLPISHLAGPRIQNYFKKCVQVKEPNWVGRLDLCRNHSYPPQSSLALPFPQQYSEVHRSQLQGLESLRTHFELGGGGTDL